MHKLFVIILILVVILGAAWWYTKNSQQSDLIGGSVESYFINGRIDASTAIEDDLVLIDAKLKAVGFAAAKANEKDVQIKQVQF